VNKRKGQKARNNRHKTTQKTKDWTSLTTLKTRGELMCSDVASSCYSCYKSSDKSWTRKAGRNWLFIFCHIKHKLPWPTFYVEQFFNLIKSYQWNIMSCTLHFIIIKSCIYNTEISAFILLKCGTYNKFNMLVLRAVLVLIAFSNVESGKFLAH
jgi:hypothetical protein